MRTRRDSPIHEPTMIEPMKSILKTASMLVSDARCRRALGVLALAGIIIGTLPGCAHDPDKKKKRKPKHRDPVEQKVFYDGWWPKRL